MFVIPEWSQRIGALPGPVGIARNDSLKSSRAAHIGFAAADHALRRGLGVRLGGGSAGAVFEFGYYLGAPPEPRFGTGRELRQRLRDIVDGTERVQGTGARIADFIDARGNRRLDILATPGPWIPFPFTPGRYHYCPFTASNAGINLMKIWSPAASVFAAIRTLYYQNRLKNSP